MASQETTEIALREATMDVGREIRRYAVEPAHLPVPAELADEAPTAVPEAPVPA
jgi:hypothetical protein